MLGRSGCEVLSCVDPKDALLQLRPPHTELKNSVVYSHILVALTVSYEVLPKELSISPQVWFSYTETLLERTPNKQS